MDHRRLVCQSVFVLSSVALFGCASTPAQAPSEPAAQEPPAAEPPLGQAPPVEPSADAAPPPSEAPAGETPAPGGRLAFTQCDPQNRPTVCTREYRAVCGEVDTGVRCIKAPCPSTQQKTFGNACMACAEAKTTGYWPVSCEEMKKENTSAPAP